VSQAFKRSRDAESDGAAAFMLVDTSVWVDHLRRGDPALTALLNRAEVECHPFVIGELACGSLHRRSQVLSLLERLPDVPVVDHSEVLMFVERHTLMRYGVGWIDMHLLASAALAGVKLWTRDRHLARVARTLHLYAEP
jgi:predicted nucleic acid-binding protein